MYQDAYVFQPIHDGGYKVQFSTAGVARADLVITFLLRSPNVIIIWSSLGFLKFFVFCKTAEDLIGIQSSFQAVYCASNIVSPCRQDFNYSSSIGGDFLSALFLAYRL